MEVLNNLNKQTFTREEVLSIIEANGLDIRHLAGIARGLKNGTIEETHNTPQKRNIGWNLVLAKYPDFVIEKTTAQTIRRLVVMASSGEIYVEQLNNKGEQIALEKLTQQNYSAFSSGMPNIELPENFWLQQVYSGKEFFTRITKAFLSETYLEMVRLKIAPKFESLGCSEWHKDVTHSSITTYAAIPKIYKEFCKDEEIKSMLEQSVWFIQDMIDNFGINNTRDFIRSWKDSLFKKSGRWGSTGDVFGCARACIDFHHVIIQNDPYKNKSCRPRCDMKYAAFKDYVLYKSVQMGYGLNVSEFWRVWTDTINMQLQIYGKIKDKYPDNLPTYHNQLAYQSTLRKNQIDGNNFLMQSKKTQKYETKIGKYVFIAPKTPDDFYDEATQQANCLASYVEKYTNGRSHIVFMRLAADPATSLVTIEMQDGQIRQSYQAYNRACTEEQRRVIEDWIEYVEKVDAGKIKTKDNKQTEKTATNTTIID